jgi:hypothetical protein
MFGIVSGLTVDVKRINPINPWEVLHAFQFGIENISDLPDQLFDAFRVGQKGSDIPIMVNTLFGTPKIQ